jgi:glycosyltransferase involved in cell wall biosynthesis
MKVLITTPFFSNLGGSELETIHTANTFSSFKKVDEVVVYVHGKFDLNFIEGIFISSKVKFIRKPFFFENKYLIKANKFLIKMLKLKMSPLENLYWNFFYLKTYDRIYIITKSTLDYYLPLIKNYKAYHRIWVKYTTIFFDELPALKHQYLSKIAMNSVTSEKQALFFRNELKLNNVDVQEIILHNEAYVLEKERTILDKRLFDFGILGRFSEEKQFEDAIDLVAELKGNGFNARLLITGNGCKEYFLKIENRVVQKGLSGNVKLEFVKVNYDQVYDFFDRINCFLITSKYEGGPNIGLEVMAYGLPILSYDVGAMKDRLSDFSKLIVIDKKDLIKKAEKILRYSEPDFLDLCHKIKANYIVNYSNENKISAIDKFLYEGL